MTPTNQIPSECKHFYAGWLCNERKKKSRRYSYERPCILICDRDTCPDYEPKEKKDEQERHKG